MKTYRVVLTSLGTVLVEADSAVEENGVLCFLRAGTVHARYALATVKYYEEFPAISPPSPNSERSHRGKDFA
jgi:hypothetical protein